MSLWSDMLKKIKQTLNINGMCLKGLAGRAVCHLLSIITFLAAYYLSEDEVTVSASLFPELTALLDFLNHKKTQSVH